MLGDEATWREALAGRRRAARCRGLVPGGGAGGRQERCARIGIEGVEDDEDGHWIPAKDVQWARKLNEDGSLGRKARVAGDLLEVGDVVHVRRMTSDSDGSFIRWTLRQMPEVQGGFMAMDVQHRPRAGDAGRVFLSAFGVQPRHAGDAAAGIALQAVRLCRGAGQRVYARPRSSSTRRSRSNTPQGVWRPTNASNQFYGPTPLRTGIEQSRNLMTVRLAQEVGMDTVARYAERFGVYDKMQPFLANALGSQETTLFKMVAAYAMFANGGERVEPTLVDRVQDRWGETVYRHDQRDLRRLRARLAGARAWRRASSRNRERVMDAITAYQLTSMMQGVVQRGTAAGTVNLPVPIAGKTGTTNDAKDVWFIGFTSNIVAGCYIGYDQPRRMGRGASGGGMCGPVFNEFMQKADREIRRRPVRGAAGRAFHQDRPVHRRAAAGRWPAGEYVVAEYFRDGEEPIFGIMFDGGFAMGANLPLFGARRRWRARRSRPRTARSSMVPEKADFGTLSLGRAVLSGGIAAVPAVALHPRDLAICRFHRPGTAGCPMRAETQNTVDAIQKSLTLLAPADGLGNRPAPAGGIQRAGRGSEPVGRSREARKS